MTLEAKDVIAGLIVILNVAALIWNIVEVRGARREAREAQRELQKLIGTREHQKWLREKRLEIALSFLKLLERIDVYRVMRSTLGGDEFAKRKGEELLDTMFEAGYQSAALCLLLTENSIREKIKVINREMFSSLMDPTQQDKLKNFRVTRQEVEETLREMLLSET